MKAKFTCISHQISPALLPGVSLLVTGRELWWMNPDGEAQ
jgi:hypothetical protein